MTNPYRAMCAELVELSTPVDSVSQLAERLQKLNALAARARALLAQPEPVAEGPTDEELLRVAATGIEPYEISGITPGEYEPETECAVEAYGSELIAFAREVLHRWGRPTPQPVAVSKRLDWRRPNALPTPQPVAASERLPGPEDCDEQGRCWVFDDQLGLPSWTLIRVQGGSLAPDMYWLPAHALPTPEATND